MDRPVPPPEGLTSAAEIAQALGVTVQAVSNWMGRHPDFPQPVEGDGASRFDVEEVARWLDGRRIHGTVRRDDEGPGDTYGLRYRRSLGLASSTGTAAGSGAPGHGGGSRRPASTGPGARGGVRSRRTPVTAGPWAEVMGALEGGDRGTQQDVVTALLWLKASAPDEWWTSAAEHHGGIAARLADRWSSTVPPLPSVLNDRWWRTRLPKAALALDRTPAASQPQAFAALLDRLAEDRRDHLGWVLTPPGLAQAMVRLADPQPGETVVDPCCGYGELLVAAGRHPVREGDQRGVRLRGVVHDERAGRLTLMNAQANHLTVDVEEGAGDLLCSFPGGSFDWWGGADVVLTNPPFTQADWTDDDPAQHGAWPYGPPPQHEAAFAWLQIAFAALTDTGRAVVVAPPHATDPRNVRERRILQGMVEDGVVRCVIDLPARLFRETSTPVSVWLLGPPERETDRGPLLIDTRPALSGQGATHRALDTSGQDRILAVWNAWLAGQDAEVQGFSTIPSRRQIRDQSYALSPSRYLRPPQATTSSLVPARHEPRSLTDLHLELARLQEHARHLDTVVGRQVSRILGGKTTVTTLDTFLGTPPAGWDTVALASICDVTVGRCRPTRTPSTVGGVPVISPAQIAGGRIHLDSAHRLHPDEAELYAGDAVLPGDLIMTRKGARRRHALVTPDHVEAEALVDGSCFIVRVRYGGRELAEFFNYYLTHPGVQEWLGSRTHMGLVPNLPVDRLRELPVLLPPPTERSEIVQLYRTMDEQIQTYEQILATTRQLRRRLIEPLLAVGEGPGK